MGNPNLLPYETIVRATSGEPEAVDEVLRHYSKRIRIAAIENGHIDRNGIVISSPRAFKNSSKSRGYSFISSSSEGMTISFTFFLIEISDPVSI